MRGFHLRISITTYARAEWPIYSILDTSSPQPDDKQDGARRVRYIAFDMFCMRSGSKWPMIGARPCAYAFVYVDPILTSQSYDIGISTTTTKKQQ